MRHATPQTTVHGRPGQPRDPHHYAHQVRMHSSPGEITDLLADAAAVRRVLIKVGWTYEDATLFLDLVKKGQP